MIYHTLSNGPSRETFDAILPRSALVQDVKKLISPKRRARGYSLIIGERGTGKTSLIELAIDKMNLPKGIVYVNIPTMDHMNIDPSNVDEALKEALGWIPNPKTDKESGE
jgi:predicted AAA+ superfamily ATPase